LALAALLNTKCLHCSRRWRAEHQVGQQCGSRIKRATAQVHRLALRQLGHRELCGVRASVTVAAWLCSFGSCGVMFIAKPIRFGGALAQAKPGYCSAQACGLGSGCSMLLPHAAAICHEQTRCLTLRSRGRPPASQLGREALVAYHPPRGQAVFPASSPQLKR